MASPATAQDVQRYAVCGVSGSECRSGCGSGMWDVVVGVEVDMKVGVGMRVEV